MPLDRPIRMSVVRIADVVTTPPKPSSGVALATPCIIMTAGMQIWVAPSSVVKEKMPARSRIRLLYRKQAPNLALHRTALRAAGEQYVRRLSSYARLI